MKKTISLTVLTVVIGWLIAALVIFWPQPQSVNVNESVWSSYHATCRVTMNHARGQILGTGVTLNTGYILTAAHCVDVNMNDRVDPDERALDVEFFGSVASIQSASVVFCGTFEGYDIAVLEVPEPPESNVYLTDVEFGEKVFAIGCTSGSDPNISEGRASSDVKGLSRAGLAVWRGNSGGGIWSQDEGLAGIVTRLGLGEMYSRGQLVVPTENGLMIINMRQSFNVPLANWCEYVSAADIKECLDDKGLGFVYEEQKEPINVNPHYPLMVFEILGVLICAWFFRKHLLG